MKTEFIAEVSSNHSRKLNRCLEFIHTAKRIGCDGVKFQLFKIDELFAPEILSKSEEHRGRKQWELPEEFIPKLAHECHGLGLKFACTPFYMQAVDLLFPFVDYYKIASYEILWDDFLKKIADKGKPIMLSTGMATLDEVVHAVNVLRGAGATDITVDHCVSSYPAPACECNLAVLETFRQALKCPVGWSDHSVDAQVVYRSVFHWQAASVEFHLDLDGQGDEFDRGYNWLPEQIEKVITNVRNNVDPSMNFISADGDGIKQCKESELIDREWRADPSDGLRPMLHIRKEWQNK